MQEIPQTKVVCLGCKPNEGLTIGVCCEVDDNGIVTPSFTLANENAETTVRMLGIGMRSLDCKVDYLGAVIYIVEERGEGPRDLLTNIAFAQRLQKIFIHLTWQENPLRCHGTIRYTLKGPKVFKSELKNLEEEDETICTALCDLFKPVRL